MVQSGVVNADDPAAMNCLVIDKSPAADAYSGCGSGGPLLAAG